MSDVAIRELQRFAGALDKKITQRREVAKEVASHLEEIKTDISNFTSELQKVQDSIQVLKAIDSFTKQG